jgi:hypothetical protein
VKNRLFSLREQRNTEWARGWSRMEAIMAATSAGRLSKGSSFLGTVVTTTGVSTTPASSASDSGRKYLHGVSLRRHDKALSFTSPKSLRIAAVLQTQVVVYGMAPPLFVFALEVHVTPFVLTASSLFLCN